MDHLHDAFERPGGRRIARRVADPAPDCTPGEDGLSLSQRAAVGRVEVAGETVEEIPLGARERRCPHQKRHGVALGDVSEQREQFGAHPIPPNRRIRVRLIHDRIDPHAPTEFDGLRSAETEDRVLGAGSHRGKTGRPGAAQKPEQHRLGLIIRGMSRHRARRHRGKTGLAGAGLKIGAGFDGHLMHFDVDSK